MPRWILCLAERLETFVTVPLNCPEGLERLAGSLGWSHALLCLAGLLVNSEEKFCL